MPINRYSQRGINMVEVMVTIVITSIGLLGLSSLQLQANRSTHDSGNRSQAVWMLEDMANRVRANTVALASYDTGNDPVSCNNAPAKICTAHHDGNNRIAAAADCTNDEMALSDLWEVACGFGAAVNNSSVTRSSPTDFIANPELIVGVNNANNQVTITLSWDVRTSGTDQQGATVYANTGNITDRRATLTSVIQP